MPGMGGLNLRGSSVHRPAAGGLNLRGARAIKPGGGEMPHPMKRRSPAPVKMPAHTMAMGAAYKAGGKKKRGR